MFDREHLELASTVLDRCRDRGLHLATAESCTGGLIAGCLTGIPGSSHVVDRGFVTYSNSSKMEMLGVPADLVMSHGAVSGRWRAPWRRCAGRSRRGHHGRGDRRRWTGRRYRRRSGRTGPHRCGTGDGETTHERHMFTGDREESGDRERRSGYWRGGSPDAAISGRLAICAWGGPVR